MAATAGTARTAGGALLWSRERPARRRLRAPLPPARAQQGDGGFGRSSAFVASPGGQVVRLVAKTTRGAPLQQASDAEPGAWLESVGAVLHELRLPLGAAVEKVGDGKMRFTLPRVALYDVWLQPVADTFVRDEPGTLLLTSDSAALDGSSHVADLGLDKRYDCSMTLRCSAPRGSSLDCAAELVVNVDVPPPFSLMPGPALVLAGSTALQTMLDVIVADFARTLAGDFKRWASSPAERARRQA